jgi:hypothetical protein
VDGGCARSAPKRRATTLIELLVVIAVIGTLITFLIPSLKRSMTMARSTVCMHNLREIDHALQLYRVENDGWLPPREQPPHGLQQVGRQSPWFCLLFPTYLQDPMILTCPEDPYRYRMLRMDTNVCDSRMGDYASYGINSFIMLGRAGELANLDRHLPSRPLDTILLGDLGPDRPYSAPRVTQSVGPARNTGLMPWDDGVTEIDLNKPPWLTTRHSGGINFLTTVNSVRRAKTVDVMRRRIDRFYENCSAGGCTFCNEFQLDHYSFAKDRLFWWTGASPAE